MKKEDLNKEYDFFISYTTRNKSDEKRAIWLESALRVKLGYKSFIQEYEIQVGDNFRAKMHEGLAKANRVICILSEDYVRSENCIDEFTSHGKLVPVRFDDYQPEGLLSSRVYIDLAGMDNNEDAMIEALRIRLIPKQRPDYLTELPVPEKVKKNEGS
jgi:hypothetical protein